MEDKKSQENTNTDKKEINVKIEKEAININAKKQEIKTEIEKEKIIIKEDDGSGKKIKLTTLYITTDEKKRLKNLKKIGQRKDEEEKIYLDIKEIHLLSPKPMNETQIRNSRKKLERFIEIDTNRTKLIEKKNKLEILIFQRKEWLENDRSKPYLKPGELENATDFISNKSLWFEDESYAATYETLDKVIKNITNYFKPFEKRTKRHYDRIQALNKFLNDLKLESYHNVVLFFFRKV